jgi:type I restriction enzyme, S subunit
VNLIPPSWGAAPLISVADVLDSRRIPVNASDRADRTGDVPYYGATGRVGWINDYLFDEELVLLGEDGAPFLDAAKPKAYMIDGPAWVNNHAHVLRARRELATNRYLKHYLNHFDYHGYARGTTRLKLTRADMDGIPIPLPPLAEQERIVAVIEEQFSRLDAGVAALERARKNLKRMLAAVLQGAVTGTLTLTAREAAAERQGLGGTPSEWRRVRVDEVAEVSGGITKNPKRKPICNSVPFLRVANVPRDGLDLSEIHQIEVFPGELERLRLRPGDLLVVEGNGSPDQIGRSALWSGQIDPCVHQNHLIRVRPSAQVLPEYLNLFWNAPSTMSTIRAVASSTSGLYTLSTNKVRAVEVALPPLATQTAIVSRVKLLMSFMSQVDSAIEAQTRRAARLRSSVLAYAFSGKLVPQDSSDEPASALLARIATERSFSGPRRSIDAAAQKATG